MSERPAEPSDHIASDENTLIERLKEIQDLVKEEDGLVRRGARLDAHLLLCIGEGRCYVTIEAGHVIQMETTPQRMRSVDFIISGPASSWRRYWEPIPKPGWHDLFAMNKRGELAIEGNLLIFMQNLQYFKDLLALPRKTTRTPSNA